MTTHVVCLDGTGQTYDQSGPNKGPTNIALIFKALGGVVVDADSQSFESTLTVNNVVVQVGKYLAGIGTSGLALFELFEQATGEGVAESIVRGYTFLCRNYAPGDEIIIVGFSRGAAAARCLAGFVVTQGLLNPANYHPENKGSAYLRAIAAWNQYRANQPWLAKDQVLTTILVQLGEQVPQLTPADYVPVERILAVGVFDTVSSSGVPNLADQGKYGFSFANTDLSPKVLNGYHALAADEIRSSFLATYWTPRENITQVIFPGAHSDIGGGYGDHGLSDRALQWMLPNLKSQGLRFDLENIRPLAPNAADFGHDDSDQPDFVNLPKAPRVFPDAVEGGAPAFTVDTTIGARWGRDVTILAARTSGPYQASGVFTGNKPLYP
ncbi:MAG: DUF2235 domain-containing protein [Caulobacterales bacterium]